MNQKRFVELRALTLEGTPRQKSSAYDELYRIMRPVVLCAVHKQCFNMCYSAKVDMVHVVTTHILTEDRLLCAPLNEDPSGWLYIVAVRKCIDEYKKHSKHNQTLSLDNVYTSGDEHGTSFDVKDPSKLADELIHSATQRELVRKLVDEKLKGTQQLIVRLRYFEQKSQKEIMTIMGLDKNKCGVLLNRAVTRLRKILEKYRGQRAMFY